MAGDGMMGAPEFKDISSSEVWNGDPEKTTMRKNDYTK
jgi:hypothetical protein